MKTRITAYWPCLALFVLSLCISLHFCRLGLDMVHDSAMFKPAVDVAEGKILFRESFSQYGALTVFLQALALLIFGKFVVVLKIQTALFSAGGLALLWIVLKRILPPWLAFFTCVLWIFMDYYFVVTFFAWAPVYALFFQILALHGLVRFFETALGKYLFLTGVALALSFYSKQPYGVFFLFLYLLLFFLLGLAGKTSWKTNLANGTLLVAGFSAVAAAFTLLFIAQGSLRDWWLQSIVYAAGHRSTVGASTGLADLFKQLFFVDYTWPSDIETGDLVFILMPLANLMLFAEILKDLFTQPMKDSQSGIVAAFCLTALASWLQYYPNPGIGHRYWAATLIVGPAMYYLRLNTQRFSPKARPALRDGFFILTVLAFFGAALHARFERGLAHLEKAETFLEVKNPQVLRGIRVPPEDVAIMDEFMAHLNDYLHSHPGSKVLLDCEYGIFTAMFPDFVNFHPMWMLNPAIIDVIYPDYWPKRKDFARANHPLIITTPMSEDQLKKTYPGYKQVQMRQTTLALLTPE